MTSNNTEFAGWTPSPDGRGTYDIILTCLITTTLCCWTSVYPNIPGPHDGDWANFRDRLGLAFLGLLGPDFIIVLAIGQKSSAQRSVRKFRLEGHRDWTMAHAFFADMGGFVLKAHDLERTIPLNAEQVFYLVQKGFIGYPIMTIEELKDRDKSDGLARLLTVCQSTWFVISLIARAIEGLAITTMELTTLSFVINLFGTAWCWKDKLSDARTTITLETPATIDEILATGGARAQQPYYQTPLDFISRDETALNLVWQYYNELGRKIFFSPFSRRNSNPWDRIPGDIFLRMEFNLELVGVAFILAFSAVFLLAWHFDFPSTAELIFWRASSIYMITYGMLGALWMELAMWIFIPQSRAAEGLLPSALEESSSEHPFRKWHQYLQDWWKNYRRGTHHHPVSETDRDLLVELEVINKKVPGFLSRSHNISPDKDPNMQVQIGFLIVTSILCGFYCIFRAYILIEDVIGLRSLPKSAYQTVNWLTFLPHI